MDKRGRPKNITKDTLRRRVNLSQRQKLDWRMRLREVHDFQALHDGWKEHSFTELEQTLVESIKSLNSEKAIEGGKRFLQKVRLYRSGLKTDDSKKRKASNRVPIPLPLAVLIYGSLVYIHRYGADINLLVDLYRENSQSKRWPTFNVLKWLDKNEDWLEIKAGPKMWLAYEKHQLLKKMFTDKKIFNLLPVIRELVWSEYVDEGKSESGNFVAEACMKVHELEMDISKRPSHKKEIIQKFDTLFVDDLALALLFVNEPRFDLYRSYTFMRPI